MQSVLLQKELPLMFSAVPRLLFALLLFSMGTRCVDAQSCPAKQHPTFRIEVAQGLASERLSGRLIVMLSTQSQPVDKITPSFGPDAHSVWVAAKEIRGLTPDTPQELDPDELAYPQKFCTAPEGSYKIQAVLDVNHDFAYHDASDGDFVSKVVEQIFHPATDEVIPLTLVERTADAPLQLSPHTELFDFVSPELSKFWGRPIHMRGAILVPPRYSAGKSRYPTVYMTHGFGADMKYLAERSAGKINKLMEEKKIPEMIWVFMLEACPGGTHEFADSVNNGPWGTALTTELIPNLESKYRMDAKPRGRLLTGHSSGGWAALWIQVSHPKFFGGTWPTAPDTTDFRTFAAQTDLTKQPPPNFYRTDAGSPRLFVRMDGKDTQSMEDLAQQERVLGDYSGQLASFEWVFSPRGQDGRPMPLFDRDTGKIDAEVAAYWEEHYDIAHLLRTNWKTLGPLLNGKIHMTVGTADTFHLDESARLLEQTIKDLGGKASFTYPVGRNHFDLYQGGLTETIAKEMYAVARPAGGN
jgi:hypothetical protein